MYRRVVATYGTAANDLPINNSDNIDRQAKYSVIEIDRQDQATLLLLVTATVLLIRQSSLGYQKVRP